MTALGVAPSRVRAADGGPLTVTLGLAGLALGGCQINAVDLGRTLRAAGHDVSLFAVADETVTRSVTTSVVPYAEAAGLDIEILPAGQGLWRTARAIDRLAAAHHSDVVHVFAPWLARPLGVAAASWRARAAVETNWTMANAFWGSPAVPLIVGTGAMLAEAAPRRAAVHLMEPPVDAVADRPDPGAGRAFREAHGIADTETLVAVVSRLDREMKAAGIEQAIAAVAAADTPLRLVVVGDGDAFADLAAAARRVDTALRRSAVVLTGSLLDPHPAYAAADIVLGMGGSAIRGLAHGKPVVVLGEDGFLLTYEPDTVPHFRREGFYGHGGRTDPVGELAATLDALAADPARRAELGAFGLRQVADRFGLAAAADGLVGVYRQALTRLPSRPRRAAEAGRLLAREGLSRTRRLLRERP
ncbi:glycosyltransferase [Nocardioides sp.]|uniref:glycosyltransferase n=1 Tax=Nocardioides sp. TaxID=35761 RepID=UPI0039E53189